MIKATFCTGKDALERIAGLAGKKNKRSLHEGKVEINDRSRCQQPIRQGAPQLITSTTTSTCYETFSPLETEANKDQRKQRRRAENIKVPEMTSWQKFQVILPFIGIVTVMIIGVAASILIVI